VRNNPVLYNDPTGHAEIADTNESKCDKDCAKLDLAYKIKKKYNNVTIKDPRSWELQDLQEIQYGLNMINGRDGFDGNKDAMSRAFGSVTFIPVANGSLDTTLNGMTLNVNANADYKTGIINVTPNAISDNIIHEMGHILSGSLKRIDDNVPSYREMYSNIFDAGPGASQYARDVNSPAEDFADTFLALIRDGRNTSAVTQPRVDVMAGIIKDYVNYRVYP
jgi:hypothetical protein